MNNLIMYHQPDRSILLKLREGSAEAFEELFHKYGLRLYSFILKLSSGDTYLAEEMVQRTFIRIWETHSSLDPDKSFISYLCTIAKHLLINEYKHRTVEYVYKDYVLKYDSNSDNATEKEVNKNLLEEYIDSLIEKLPPRCKQIFVLSRKGMLSNKEISQRLQISVSTVQTQLTKAVSFMKEHLAKYYDHMLLLIFLFEIVN